MDQLNNEISPESFISSQTASHVVLAAGENPFENNLLIKKLLEILNEIVNKLPYEIYNIYYKISEYDELIIGIGGVNDIRDIGDLYLSMKFGKDGDHSKPGACFYRRVDKNNNPVDHNNDIARIADFLKNHEISENQYKLIFDQYLGNLTLIFNKNILKVKES